MNLQANVRVVCLQIFRFLPYLLLEKIVKENSGNIFDYHIPKITPRLIPDPPAAGHFHHLGVWRRLIPFSKTQSARSPPLLRSEGADFR